MATARKHRKTPTQARARRTVDAILGAAAQVFARRGYAGATTNHIAARAGVSIGSVYEYFGDKNAILVALLERHIDDAERALEAVAAGAESFGAMTRAAVTAMVELHAREPALHRVLFEETPRPPAVRRRLADVEHRTVEAVAAVLVLHGLSGDASSALATAKTVARLVEGLTHRSVLDGDLGAGDVRAVVDDIVCAVLAYVEARRGGVTAARAG